MHALYNVIQGTTFPPGAKSNKVLRLRPGDSLDSLANIQRKPPLLFVLGKQPGSHFEILHVILHACDPNFYQILKLNTPNYFKDIQVGISSV